MRQAREGGAGLVGLDSGWDSGLAEGMELTGGPSIRPPGERERERGRREFVAGLVGRVGPCSEREVDGL